MMSSTPNPVRVCRLCLSQNDNNWFDVFDLSLTSSAVSLQEKINTCLPVKISSDGQLPTKLCGVCLDSVNRFYDFWVQTKSSQRILENSSGTSGQTSPLNGVFDEISDRGECSNLHEINEPINACPSSPSTIPDTSAAPRKPISSEKNVCRACGVHATDSIYKTICSRHLPCSVCKQNEFPEGAQEKEKRKYECSLCEYNNYSLSNFKIHMMKHNGEYLVKCRYCDKGFYSKSTCDEHIVMKHTQRISTNHCPQCNTTYHSKAYLRRHLKTHSPNFKRDNNYQCEVCGKTYLSWKGVHRHKMSDHQGQMYQCEICDKEIKSLESLKNHRKIHRGEKSFVCATCGKAFRTRNGLTVHERVHTGFKPFKCHICDKSFSQSSSLKIHLRYHKGDRPYHCTHCDKRYVSRFLLKKHEISHVQTIQPKE